jgi:hypothetical protein
MKWRRSILPKKFNALSNNVLVYSRRCNNRHENLKSLNRSWCSSLSKGSTDIFIKNTKDVVEQLYGEKVTRFFPNYAEFWLKFIGDPKKDTPTEYGLTFDSKMKTEDKEEVTEIYKEIRMAHYSLFCNLAGTHFQAEKIESILKLPDSKEKIFEHWETFEVCYIHLGSVFNQMYHLWGLFFLLEGQVTRKNHQFRPSARKKLEEYLNKKGQGDFVKRIIAIEETVKAIRDSVVHYSRLPSIPIDREFRIPFNVKQVVWEKQFKDGKSLETGRKIKLDLKETEKLINDLHSFLINEIEAFLKKRLVKVNY